MGSPRSVILACLLIMYSTVDTALPAVRSIRRSGLDMRTGTVCRRLYHGRVSFVRSSFCSTVFDVNLRFCLFMVAYRTFARCFTYFFTFSGLQIGAGVRYQQSRGAASAGRQYQQVPAVFGELYQRPRGKPPSSWKGTVVVVSL